MVNICKGDVVRNLTKTIAAVSLLVPASAYSLGIGDIKLHSALNQTLEAEIALLVSEGENISDLRVRLAPPEKFDEAGIPWSYFLSKIKFVPVLRPDGSAMVKVSSQDILKEPFLDFLVEVTWDKGNLYREFTVLVDPPAAYTQPVVPVVKKAESAPVTIVEEKTVTRQSLENKILDGSRTTRTTRRDGKYGPIRRNESLWRIAERTNSYSDVSIEQMMMAIYQANQSAFDGNVNSLRAGQTLEIPEKEVILNLTKKQAKAAFIRQTEAWKGHPVVAKAKQHSSQVISRGKAQLDLKAPADDEIADTAIVVAENEVLASRIAELEKEKSSGTLSQEGLALQARMAKLEQQLEMMQKMLVLKDEQITVLQQELDQVPNDLLLKEPIVDQGVEPESTKQPVEDTVKPGDTLVTPTSPAAEEEVTKVEDKELAVDKPEEKQAEPKSDWELPVMSALAISLLGGLGWLFWRRKKNNDEMDAESMFSAASGISMPDPEIVDGISSEMAESSSFESAPTDESSLIGEFETSDFNSFYTEQSEVDPVLEADVYLAYGRHQQAEELMLQAIADQPDRDECKLKLLEVYQADENKNSFEKYTTELLNAGKNNDGEFWDKVVEMGTKLNIEPGLLGEDVGKKATFDLSDADESSTPAVDENSVDNSDALLSEHADVAVDDEAEAVVETANEMEFDLSIFDEDEKDLDLEIEGGGKNDNGLDFDLSQFDLDNSDANSSKNSDLELLASETEKKLEIDVEEKSDEIESFDFDMEAKAASEDESELSKFDFNNLSSLAGENDSFSLEAETSLDTKSNDLDAGLSGLTDEDELETKIDLAKAYIDMEDTDSAKAIAEEVLEKGNEKQKQAAQDIIKQLDQA